MALNDYIDQEIDEYIHPERAIPSGKVSPKSILTFSILIFLFSLFLSFFINIICFGIVVISILLLFIYEKFFKNQGLVGNISVAFLSSMTFVFGGASTGKIYNASILSIMTFFHDAWERNIDGCSGHGRRCFKKDDITNEIW